MVCIPEGKNLRGHLRISQNSANHNKYLQRNQEKISSGWLKGKMNNVHMFREDGPDKSLPANAHNQGQPDFK